MADGVPQQPAFVVRHRHAVRRRRRLQGRPLHRPDRPDGPDARRLRREYARSDCGPTANSLWRMADARGTTGRSTRCGRSSSCRSWTWSAGPGACTSSSTTPTSCTSTSCCRSRPARAPRTAATARSRCTTTPGVKPEPLMQVDEVVRTAKRAKAQGVTRFCMGAAWRDVKDNAQFDRVLDMVRQVNDLGLEVCVTLGMLTADQARKLDEAGLYAYNHNLDTSPEYYDSVITTRTYQDRLDTIENLRTTSITVCCGGIIGMGESVADRISFLHRLATLDPHPESVPINVLVTRPRHAARGCGRRRDRRDGAHDRGGAHAHADVGRAHRRGPAPDELLRPGAVLPRRRELDLHERAQHDAHRDDAVRRPRHPTARCSRRWACAPASSNPASTESRARRRAGAGARSVAASPWAVSHRRVWPAGTWPAPMPSSAANGPHGFGTTHTCSIGIDAGLRRPGRHLPLIVDEPGQRLLRRVVGQAEVLRARATA